MSKNRYSNTEIIDNTHYGTFKLPVRARGLSSLKLLTGISSTEYMYKAGDRLDILAAKFWGEDQYWWVIALVNDISYPFSSGGLIPGRILKIPNDPRDIFERIFP